MVPPDQFNSSGKITKSGKDYATYRLVDPNNIPENMKDQFVADEYGNLHPVTRQQINIQPSEDLQGYTKEGNKVYYDQSGNPYIFGNQQADIYQPGTNKKVTVPAVPGSPVPSYEQASGARGLSAPTNPATLAQNSSLATYTPNQERQNPNDRNNPDPQDPDRNLGTQDRLEARALGHRHRPSPRRGR
jgi:hypothetical protein